CAFPCGSPHRMAIFAGKNIAHQAIRRLIDHQGLPWQGAALHLTQGFETPLTRFKAITINNEPNYFLIQRKALARFRKAIPFLALIPDRIYRKLSPLSWYEPFGAIEQARAQLEQELDCYIMIYKRFEPDGGAHSPPFR